jgi:hypothetical protein
MTSAVVTMGPESYGVASTGGRPFTPAPRRAEPAWRVLAGNDSVAGQRASRHGNARAPRPRAGVAHIAETRAAGLVMKGQRCESAWDQTEAPSRPRS